tara:strand:+ start:2264 stop:2476 length:213 start_codon:yes stop_codon:yes gene_type:complete
MNAEKISNNDETNIPLNTPELNETISSGRVDINHLLARVRKQEKIDNKTNLIFVFMLATFVLIIGILLSF